MLSNVLIRTKTLDFTTEGPQGPVFVAEVGMARPKA